MSRHRNRHLYAQMMTQAPLNTVMSLRVSGHAAVCGCAANCCCCGAPAVPKLPPQYFVPEEAAAFMTIEELNSVIHNVNSIQENNYIPVLPLLFTHFCIPFSPICIISCYESSRNRLLREFVDRVNRETFVSRGCHWELLSLDHVSYVALHLVSHHPSQAQAVATPTVAQPTYAYAANNYPAVATVVPVYPMTYDNGAVTGVH